MRRHRAADDRGVAVVLVALMLAPLLVFAAYGVDLAHWRARVTYLQKSADAAASAGAVWMPNLPKATQVATEALAHNGIVSGTGDMVVEITEGATPTSLRVEVTDTNPERFLSAMFSQGQTLTRVAEAEYALTLPLGSPLNYFGGDRSKTQLPDTTVYSVTWPLPAGSTSRPPAGPSFPCNVGTSASQNLGRWTNATTFDSTGYSGSTRCQWTVLGVADSGTTSVPPPDHTTRPPVTQPCRVRADGNASGTVLGRWNAGTYTAGSGGSEGMCSFTVYTTDATSVPTFSATTGPQNRPCNVGYETSNGRWPTSGAYVANAMFTAADSAGNRLCRWNAATTSSVVPGANPIPADRDPGFWAQVEGPGTVGALGDAFSSRCTTALYCAAQQSAQHRSTGYWYVIKMPTGSSETTVSIFDAGFRRGGTITAQTGDALLYGSTNTTTNPTFTTEYRVYKQTNPLDISSRTPMGVASSASQTDNSCWWGITDQAAFDMQWKPLCTITPTDGDTYLLNVRSHNSGTQGVGLNGYAIQAISVGAAQPALYAYGDMGTFFNGGSGTFYLAEVGPEFAGKVLALDLWDAGDMQSGTATIYPKMPSATLPGAVADAPATCTYTSSPDPNTANGGSPAWGPTGSVYSTPQASDDATKCAINTAPSGSLQRFNDEWLRIRIQVPDDYTCTVGLNPVTTAGSCWWGIQYVLTGTPYDVTTWKARIEGNPVHLTR